MAFIRVKKVKQWEYAYLVENKWKSKRTKQKVKQYLGRVHQLENIAGCAFCHNIEKMKFKDAVKELAKFELAKSGFKANGNVLEKEDFTADFDKGEFRSCSAKQKKAKDIVFESNEGFICSHTYKCLVNFKPREDEEETALYLAEAILGAGISIPHEVFIKLYEKVKDPCMPIIEDTQKFINKASPTENDFERSS